MRRGGQAVVAPDDARLLKLPVSLREEGRRILAEPDEDRRANLAEALADKDAVAALDFLLALLDTDPSADVREDIVDQLEGVDDPRVDPALERRVLVDADPDIVLLSLELLRARHTRPLMRLLEQRLAAERKTGSADAVSKLIAEQERWTTLVRGGLLPTFFQKPPALFTVKPAEQPVRVLAFGDYGDGSAAQKQVAGAMLRYHQERPFDFAITLGDNFYPAGMDSPTDPRWDTWWSALYDPLKVPFYVSMGNHDWNQSDSPAAEILFSQRSPSWRLPAAYYTFEAGPVQFFALDTDIISEAQLRWLTQELDRSRATWKVVYGHHPIYSAGQHGDNNQKIRQLLPVLKRSRGHVHRRTRSRHAAPQARGAAALLRRRERGEAPADRARPALALCAKRAWLRRDRRRSVDADREVRRNDLSSPYSYTLSRSSSAQP